MVPLASFYDEVLRELMVAMGAALVVGNLLALARRRADSARIPRVTIARSRPGSPVRGLANPSPVADLAQAPVARTLVYAAIGLVVMVWGVASLTS